MEKISTTPYEVVQVILIGLAMCLLLYVIGKSFICAVSPSSYQSPHTLLFLFTLMLFCGLAVQEYRTIQYFFFHTNTDALRFSGYIMAVFFLLSSLILMLCTRNPRFIKMVYRFLRELQK